MNTKIYHYQWIIFFILIISLTSCSKEEPASSNPTEVEIAYQRINITSLPDKTIYALDEAIDLTGLKVEGIDLNNAKHPIEIRNEHISGFNSNKPVNDQSITITFKGKEASFSIKVLPIRVQNGTLTSMEGNNTELTLPSYIKSIGKGAFQSSKIKTITLNEGLISIAEDAFAWSEIRSINFPRSLQQIDKYAFYDCNYLEKIDLSQTSLKKIAHSTFANTPIKEAKLPEGLLVIEAQAFLSTSLLHEITIPEGVFKIGNEAFRESGLIKLRLPNSIMQMEQRAFYLSSSLEEVETYGEDRTNYPELGPAEMQSSTFERCSGLKTFAIPRSVKIIGQNTLTNAPNLTSLTIPSNIEEIKFNAFGNSSLKTVIIESATPAKAATISSAWYGFPPFVESIKVPSERAEEYKKQEGWKEFKNVIQDY